MISRRQAMQALGAAGVSIVTGSAGYGYLYERGRIEVTRATLPVSGPSRCTASGSA